MLTVLHTGKLVQRMYLLSPQLGKEVTLISPTVLGDIAAEAVTLLYL